MDMTNVLNNIEKATEFSFIEKYDQSVNVLHETKKQLHSDSDALLLINVKLARTYEYMGNDIECSKYWNKALHQLQIKEDKDSDILKQGRAELYINQLRALQHESIVKVKQVDEMIEKIDKLMNYEKPTLSTLQFMYMEISYYIRQDQSALASQICEKCLKCIPIVKDKYQNPQRDDQKAPYEAACKYLSDFLKQIKGMQIFCSKNEKLDKNSENKEASEELYEEWEEVSVYE